MINTLLTKARADTEIAIGDLKSGIEIYESILEAVPQIAAENLLRLSFLTGRKAVFEASDNTYDWSTKPSDFRVESTSDLAYLGLLFPPEEQAKAIQSWLHYLRTVERGWERDFVSQEVLKREKLTCQMCRTVPATGFHLEAPVCKNCLELLQNPDWFKTALKGQDSSAIELLENLSGETFTEPVDLDAMFPHQVQIEKTPVLSPLQDVEAFYPLFESDLQACWDRAKELVESENGLEPCHLWEALHLEPGLLSNSIHQETLQDDRELYRHSNGQADLLESLNIARWYHGLNPNNESPKISAQAVYRGLAFAFDPTRSKFYASIIGTMIGIWSNSEQIAEFERLLEDEPDALLLRLLLSNGGTSLETVSSLNPHTLWLINHAPQLAESSTAGSMWLISPHDFKKYLEAWIDALENNMNDPEVLAKAGQFFTFSQPLLSLKLYERASQLAPEDLSYRTHIGHALENVAREALDPEARAKILREAVSCCEQSLAKDQEPGNRSFYLVDALQYSFRAEDWESVERLARELLQELGDEENWNRGNNLHCAHVALGHLALNEGNREVAKSHLLAAADVEGSPQLKSFGPRFGLARRFLALGETEVVIQYLRACQSFWEQGQAYLAGLLAELEAGRIPELSGFRGE